MCWRDTGFRPAPLIVLQALSHDRAAFSLRFSSNLVAHSRAPRSPKRLGLQQSRRRRQGGSSPRCHTGETSALATGPQARFAQGKARDPRDGHDGPQPMAALMTPSWRWQLPPPRLLAPPRSSVNIEIILVTSGNQGCGCMSSVSRSCRNPGSADHRLSATFWPQLRPKRSRCLS